MKIYAKQIAPEYQESPLYMGEWPENVYVFGNRGYKDNSKRIDEIRRGLETIADTFADMQNGENWARNGNLHAVIWYELPREGGAGYTRAERLEIVRLAEMYCNCRSYDENDIICDVLEIITGKKYDNATIRGCCQGDWNYIIYPAEYGREWLKEFEIEYFNLGDEWALYENGPDGEYVFHFYTHSWRDDEKRAEIADAAGVKPDDVILYAFDGWSRTPVYKEISA